MLNIGQNVPFFPQFENDHIRMRNLEFEARMLEHWWLDHLALTKK